MKRIKQVMLFTALLILLIGAVTASNTTDTTVTNEETQTALQDTTQVSQTDTTQEKNNNNNKIIMNTKQETPTTKNIQKNTNKANTKTEPEKTVNNWNELNKTINALTESTTITLNPGTYTAEGRIDWENRKIILTIDGNGQTINANQHQAFYIQRGTTVILKNIIITNATNNGGDGGAIYNSGNLTITNTTLQHNTATDDGGAIDNSGNLTITNTTLNNNTATGDGGAIYNNKGGTITITNHTTLQYNTAEWGGAIENSGTITITNHTTLQHNTATSYGGAINNNYGGTITITNHTTLQHNNATWGGAIDNNYGGTITITNTTLQHNTATNYGGAIDNNYGGTITITNTTLQHNTATSYGGAIRNYGTITITNTTLQHNTATNYGGAIDNSGKLTITNHTTLNNNNATRGGAIDNYFGNTSIYNSTLQYNTATSYGGAIYYWTSQGSDTLVVLYNSTFTENKATNGAVIQNEEGYGKYNITFNKFQQNKASNDKETLNLGPNIIDGSIIEDNTYENTDIRIENILKIPDGNTKYTTDDEITLNFTIKLEHPEYYDEDISEKINLQTIDKTLYINGQENITTNERNHTLKELIPNKYEVYFIAGNQQSNTITFTVTGDSQIKTDKDNYEHYTGIKNTITLNITDPSKENGTINIQIKEDNTYKELLRYHNVHDGYTLTTDTIIDALKNIYTNLEDAYTINITYNNSYVNPSSTEFTLNITKQRNTTITYDIINNTEGNVQINITVLDTVYNTPINDATINITGDINQNTTTGIITDNTLTTGNHNIKIQYQETPEYKESQVNIDFTVEIDKNKKILELEEEITNLTSKLEEAQQTITILNNSNKDLTRQLEEAQQEITTLENIKNNLTRQLEETKEKLEQTQQELKTQQNTNNELNKQLEQAQQNITTLENKINNLTKQLQEAQQEITTLENTNNNLTSQINDKNKQIEQLNKQIEELNKQLDNRNNKIEDLNNKIKNITQQLEEAQTEIQTLKNTNTNLTQQINKNNKEIEQLNNKIDDLNSQLDEKDNEIDDLNTKTDNLTQQLEEAQAKVESLENANKNLTQQINKNNKEIQQLNNKIEKLNKQLDEKDNEIETLNNKTDNLTQQLEEAQAEIETLKNNNQELNKQLSQAQQEITTLENTNNNLTGQLTQTEKEIETLNKIINELINKKPIQTTITINPIKSSIGSITTLTANITDKNGNKVTGGKTVFKVNGITLKDKNNNVIYARVNNGQASINYKVQDVWIKNTSYVEAVYSGTNNYTEARTKSTDLLDISQGTVTLTLDKQTITAKAGQTITFRAKIVDAAGDNINKGKVVFKLNGKTLKDTNGETLYAQVKDGKAVLDYTIPSIYSAKAYTLTAVYGGGNYQRAETNGTLKLERKAVTINTDTITTTNGKTTIKAKIRDETGKLLITNTKLAIKINQKTILNNITSTNGIINISFTTTLRPGTYELTIISGENSIYKKGTLNTVLKI